MSQAEIPSAAFASVFRGKVSSPVSVPRSNDEGSNKLLVAEEGRAVVHVYKLDIDKPLLPDGMHSRVQRYLTELLCHLWKGRRLAKGVSPKRGSASKS